MKCVVEGIGAVGIGGLLKLVPGGEYIKDVGAYALKRHREKKAQKKLEDEAKEMIAAKADDALKAARQAVEEAALPITAREKELLTQFVAAIPEAARQSLKRKDDPSGRSLPFGYTINEPDDIVKLLPQHPPRFVPGEWVPARKGNWKLVRKLGGGGFGEVWLGRNEHSDEFRAFKFCTDPAACKKLAGHERDVIARVMKYARRHANIVPLLECELDIDTPWLMYEFVEGGTLADAISQWHSLAPAARLDRAVAVLRAVAGALGHCHAADPAIIHRDLKPANILMAGDVPRITDFGIGGTAVEYFVSEERSRGYASVMGRLPSQLSGSYSLLYSSPQQRNGDRPDPGDDVHALGVIAYQMLVARVDAEVKGNWQKRLKTDGVPETLIDLIGRSASDEPDDRPKDAREWEAVLNKLLPIAEPADEPAPRVPAKPPAAVPRPAPPPLPKPAVRKPGEVVAFPLPRGLQMPFCWIPPGTAQLGSPIAEQNAVAEQMGKRDEWLTLESEARRGAYTSKGFWLAKYPVTQDEWYAIMDDMPSYFMAGGRGADAVRGLDTTSFPVEQVSWDMIRGTGKFKGKGFLDKLNALGGTEKVFGKASAFALPHEDQWEYACRGGLGNAQPFYFGQELNGEQANINGEYPFGTTAKGGNLNRPTPVGAYEAKHPHPWGLCDMHGNVWEWCENYYGSANKSRVRRGGSWNSYAYNGRAANRNNNAPECANDYDGFRLVVSGLP